MSFRSTVTSLFSMLLAVAASRRRSAGPAQFPAVTLPAQREALKPLAYMDGVSPPAWTILPSGQKHEVTQTERIGRSWTAP